MRIVITDRSLAGNSLAAHLAVAGVEADRMLMVTGETPDAVFAPAASISDILAVLALRRRLPAVKVVVLSQVRIPEMARLENHGVSAVFPAWRPSTSAYRSLRGVESLLLPGTTIGPLAGEPETADRRLAELLRRTGIRTVCRADMHDWLAVTAAWLPLVRGAVAAAAQRGLALADAPDLVTLLTRGARERIALVRANGADLDPAAWCLLAFPEAWTIRAMRSLANSLRRPARATWLPAVGEAVAAGRHLAALARKTGVATPAAEFLDGFVLDESRELADGADGSGHPVSARERDSAELTSA